MKHLALLFLIATLGLTACDNRSAEDIGEDIDDAARDIGNAIEDSCEDITDRNCD